MVAPAEMFVVGPTGVEAAVEDADEPVAEWAEGRVVAEAAEGVVAGAGAG